MNPTFSNIYEIDGRYEFTLSGVDVSIANALRRTILTDIPRIVLGTSKIEINTSTHFHNEIMKHRIQCVPFIPVQRGRAMTDEEMSEFIKNHVVMVDILNDTNEMIYVTSEHFKIFNRETDQFMSAKETREKFPAYRDLYFIDLMRLNPSRGVNIPGEHFKATIELSMDTAKSDGCFTVVSTCSYQNSPDVHKKTPVWDRVEQAERKQLSESGMSDQAIQDLLAFKKRDFELLDAQKYFIPNSFDFILESNGIYENTDIVYRACSTLMSRALEMIKQVDSDEIQFMDSKLRVQRGGSEFSTMDHAVDIIIPNGDYTVGYILDYIMYTLYFGEEQAQAQGKEKKPLSYCGFTKYHPHNTDGVLRIAFHNEQDIMLAKGMLKKTAQKIGELFTTIRGRF